MVKLYFTFLLLFVTHRSSGQYFFPVQPGTYKTGNNEIKSTPAGSGTTVPLPCVNILGATNCNGPFWIGYMTPGSFKHSFLSKVENVRMQIIYMHDTEVVNFKINGISYPISPSNISPFSTACCFTSYTCVAVSGNLTSFYGPWAPTTTGGGAQVDIHDASGIYSVEYTHTTGAGKGAVYAFSFAYDTFATIKPPVDTALCINDSITVPYDVNRNFRQGNTFILQLYSGANIYNIGAIQANSAGTIKGIILAGIPAGKYKMRIVSDMPVTSSADYPYEVTILDAPIVKVHASMSAICAGGQTDIFASGGIKYEWLPAVGNNNKILVSPKQTTTYIVTAIDSNACHSTDSVSIKVINIVTDKYVDTCDPAFVFNNITYTSGGDYDFKYKAANGCDSTLVLHLKIGKPQAAFNPVIPDEEGQPVFFSNQSVNADHYYWDFGDGSYTEGLSPLHTFSNVGEYTVCLVASRAENCKDSFCKKIASINRNVIDVPNAFSPNGDGNNDVLYVYGLMIREFTLKIYNRWGEMIFESNDLGRGWDGTYKGLEQPNEAYAYTLSAVFENGNTYSKKGNIIIIR